MQNKYDYPRTYNHIIVARNEDNTLFSVQRTYGDNRNYPLINMTKKEIIEEMIEQRYVPVINKYFTEHDGVKTPVEIVLRSKNNDTGADNIDALPPLQSIKRDS